MAENYQSRVERKKKQPSNKKKQPKKARKIFKTIFLTIFILGIIGVVAGGTTFAIYAKDAPPVDDVLLIDPVASELLDVNGDVFAVVGTENRDYIEYDKIPTEMIDAVLATEDVRFFKHGGIDFRRLAGAVLANVTRGFGAEGASTLTQQVVKLSFLSEDKTLKRKAQEAWLAIKLEKEYSKEQIFEIYVNKIYYANGVNGIATAAEYYFDKDLDELELQERAFLAGIPQSPSRYDPYVHPENADRRKNTVLSLMRQHGKISKEEMEAAQNKSITDTLIPKEENKGTPYKYDSFVDQVIREVEEIGDYNVYTDGLTIHTTLDPAAQEYTEKMFFDNDVVQFPDDEMQAGLVLTDTKTGEIRAIGGNRYKDIKRGRNFATTLSERQPGSTIKPIFDYGPAIEYLNWSTYEQIVDEPYQYTTGQPIRNWDQKYGGQMSIREALYKSRNIPALKAFQAAGNDNVRDFAEKVGLEYDKIENESASIGAIADVSPLKLAGAYAAFGNEGMYNKPHTVKKIILKDNETEIVNKVSPQLAMKDSTAFMVTSMLKDVISSKAGATGSGAIIPGLPAAGKTGTTNYTQEEIEELGLNQGDVPDAWFAGYTTNYTIAVWTGYENRKKPLRAGTNDQQIAKELYRNLMTHVSQDVDTPDFEMPKSVVKAAVEKGSNPAKKPSKYTPESNIVYEYFVTGTEPKETSTNFDKLDTPSVNGKYNNDSNQIEFNWNHPDKDKKGLAFDVSIKIDGEKKSLGQLSERSYILKDVEPEKTYSIEVIAIFEGQKSSAGTASVTVPKEEEKEEEVEKEEEETTPPEEDSTQEEEEKDDQQQEQEEGNEEEKAEQPEDNQSEGDNEQDKEQDNNEQVEDEDPGQPTNNDVPEDNPDQDASNSEEAE
ncbi:penicillin-binding protein 1A [Lederbergia galactosidilyticus]|uniref:transglycosylase domain-containing protein n=1 Tax=Lederbergia galactosidilytica TaxID=217031 RepID=UPI001AE919B9|nr:PBP1A family penicillin-binding protein [Lederbergia galactosidilytica]MBP1914602.1 penicillin-binding protein 1A [Lederbergia galactosidilytica]